MKTFEEYIEQASLNEAKQNYIFGGTDNRNTNTEEADFDFTDDNFLSDVEIENALKKAFETTKRKTSDGEETVVLAEITVSQDENYDKLTDETKTIVDYYSTSKTLFIFTDNGDGTASAYQLDSKVFHYLDPSNLRYYNDKGVLVFAEGKCTFDDVIYTITGGDEEMVSDYVRKLAKNTK